MRSAWSRLCSASATSSARNGGSRSPACEATSAGSPLGDPPNACRRLGYRLMRACSPPPTNPTLTVAMGTHSLSGWNADDVNHAAAQRGLLTGLFDSQLCDAVIDRHRGRPTVPRALQEVRDLTRVAVERAQVHGVVDHGLVGLPGDHLFGIAQAGPD